MPTLSILIRIKVRFKDILKFNSQLGMMINFDCSPIWFKDAAGSIRYFNVDAEYLKHEHQLTAMDYRVIFNSTLVLLHGF